MSFPFSLSEVSTVKRALANVAQSQTDSSLVTAITGKKIRVLSVYAIAGGTATDLTFNTKPGGRWHRDLGEVCERGEWWRGSSVEYGWLVRDERERGPDRHDWRGFDDRHRRGVCRGVLVVVFAFDGRWPWCRRHG
jgi:hypothetical protein